MTNTKNETKTNFLIERINQNENFQTIDINEWAFQKIKRNKEKIEILELCCGTGKQTSFLLKHFPNARISCLDISKEAIDTVKRNHQADSSRLYFTNTGIDDFFSNNRELFDIVFCSYGLYYAANIEFVLAKIYESLKSQGKLIVLGPYGKNNKQLFDALTNLNIIIAEPVISGSSKFMYEKVLAFSVNHFTTTHIYTTKNSIVWNNADNVMSYWKNSTFFNAEKENEFKKVIENEINKYGSFINEKRIMLIETIKND